VEDQEALETSAVVSKLADAVKDEVNNFLANGVVATGVVVGCVFLARDKLLGVIELAVGSSTNFVTDTRLKIDEDGTGNVLASTSLRKEGVEGVIATSNGFIRRHLSVRLNAVLEAVKLPASITSLDTSLSNVDRDTFTHFV
jgi:phosphoribosylformylglycinamidine (FGAM) synthase-like amidotransferase family enzyme